MNRIIALTSASIVLGLAVATASAQQQADFSAPEKPECIPGELLIKYKSGAASAAISAASQMVGAEVVDSFDFIGVKLIKIAPEKTG